MATFGQQTTRWTDSARRENRTHPRLKELRKEQAPERTDRSIMRILYGILFPAIICGLLAITLYHLRFGTDLRPHRIEWIKVLMEGAAFAGVLLMLVVLLVIFAGGAQELLKRAKRPKVSMK